MNKKTIFFITLLIFITAPIQKVKAETLSERLQGRILLQVEQNGEAWFVAPENQKRHFLGRPADAFQVMRDLGLGISNSDFDRFENNMPEKLLGKILLKTEDAGKAFYVYPIDKKAYFLGRPADAFQVMRELGLGVTDLSLNEILEDDDSLARRKDKQQNTSDKNEEVIEEKVIVEEENNEEKTNAKTEENITDSATSTEETSTTTEDVITLTGSKTCEFLAEYYKKETISGFTELKETVQGIDFDWGAGSPALLSNFTNKFAIRYTGDCYFEEGRYEFSSTYNDGIEATLDDFWLAKSWKNRSVEANNNVTLNIKEGVHRIKIEYYDHLGDASVKLDWTKL